LGVSTSSHTIHPSYSRWVIIIELCRLKTDLPKDTSDFFGDTFSISVGEVHHKQLLRLSVRKGSTNSQYTKGGPIYKLTLSAVSN
jgi:hypothetical protein